MLRWVNPNREARMEDALGSALLTPEDHARHDDELAAYLKRLQERDRTPTRPEIPAMPMKDLVEKDPEHVWGGR